MGLPRPMRVYNVRNEFIVRTIWSASSVWRSLRRRHRLTLAVAVALAPVALAAAPPLEYEVKAAFLFNFTKYIAWPPAALDGALGQAV